MLGAWLGASILVDVAVTQNFHAVDRFLQSAPSDTRSQQRVVLRRNAAEENAVIFLGWENVEFAVGAALAWLVYLEGSQRKTSLTAAVLLLAIVAAQHFLLTPRINSLGSIVEEIPSSDPRYRSFWMMHGIYSGLEILKMLMILGLAARGVFTRQRIALPQEALLHG